MNFQEGPRVHLEQPHGSRQLITSTSYRAGSERLLASGVWYRPVVDVLFADRVAEDLLFAGMDVWADDGCPLVEPRQNFQEDYSRFQPFQGI
jgi:hypothetical protein